MTRAEIRAVVLARLCLRSDSVIWDIGAGTGSVSVETALTAYGGHVYAIERREDARQLIMANQQRFALDNLTVVPGEAPAVLAELPDPDRIFIGGSGGAMRPILELARKRLRQDGQLVAVCITLETLAEVQAGLKELGFVERNAAGITVTGLREAGDYSMFTGSPPVFVISGRQP